MEYIKFDKMFYRKDIAHRAFKPRTQEAALTYADAGVDVALGNSFVERIKNAVRSTRRAGADAEMYVFILPIFFTHVIAGLLLHSLALAVSLETYAKYIAEEVLAARLI